MYSVVRFLQKLEHFVAENSLIEVSVPASDLNQLIEGNISNLHLFLGHYRVVFEGITVFDHHCELNITQDVLLSLFQVLFSFL